MTRPAPCAVGATCIGLAVTSLTSGAAHARGVQFQEAVLHPVVDDIGVNQSVVVTDIDGDTITDVVVRSADSGIRLFRNDGSGALTLIGTIALPEADPLAILLAGDLDGDDDVDLVATMSNNLVTLSNDGAGNFGAPVNIPGAAVFFAKPQLADLDDDGDLDIALDSIQTIFINDGSGGFSAGPMFTLDPFAVALRALAIGDVDGDGDNDLVAVSGSGIPVTTGIGVSFHEGSGVFSAGPFLEDLEAGFAFTAVLVDVDDDTDNDLVVGSPGHVKVFTNDGNGGFTFASSHKVAGNAGMFAIADLDNDDRLDVVLATDTTGPMAVLRSESVVGVRPAIMFEPEFGRSVGVTDLDGDGLLDVIGTRSSLFNDSVEPRPIRVRRTSRAPPAGPMGTSTRWTSWPSLLSGDPPATARCRKSSKDTHL